VLQDNKFRLLGHLSPSTPKEKAQNYVMFSCGLIRGALANLGVASIVSADIPACPLVLLPSK